MNLGELYFSLGFKTEGTGEAKNFEAAIAGANTSVMVLNNSMDRLIDLLKQMAEKMQGQGPLMITGQTGDVIDAELADSVDAHTQAEVKSLKPLEKKASLMSVINVKMKKYIDDLKTARLQIAAVAVGLTYFVQKAAESSVHLDKLSSVTGLSQAQLQRMGDVAAQSGASVNDVAGAISHFQQASIDIQLGKGGNIGAYNLLGINPHEDPLVLLDKIGRKLNQLPDAYGSKLASDIGLSQDVQYMLKNMKNVKASPKDTFITDAENKRLKDFYFYFNRVFEQGKRTLSKFAAFISPFITDIIYAVDRISFVASRGMNAIEPYMEKLKSFMLAIKLIGLALFAAIFPTTFVLFGLLVVLEDIGAYINGETSVFRTLINQLSDAKNNTDAFIASLKTLFSMLSLGLLTNETLDKIFDPASNYLKMMQDYGTKEENERITRLNEYNKKQGYTGAPFELHKVGETFFSNMNDIVDKNRASNKTPTVVNQTFNGKISDPMAKEMKKTMEENISKKAITDAVTNYSGIETPKTPPTPIPK